MKKYLHSEEQQGCLYLRVSSKEQEEGGFSIPAQEKFLRKYAEQKNIKITKVFAESVTGKETGRKQFNAMLKWLKAQKKACHLLCEKNDRLLRNEDDAATIKNLFLKSDVSVHLVKRNMVLDKNSTPYDIFIFMMDSAISSLYPRNLSLEVKKGMNEAAEEGYFPGKAPTGYLNQRTSKKKTKIIIDKGKAPFVIRAFELYATGVYSYRTLAQKLASEGFTIGKRKVSEKSMEKILNNPFYMGDFIYNGKRFYNCQHTPLITKELFHTVQKTIQSRTAPHIFKHDFLYSGLIKSPNGYSLVGDIKKQKYVYYRSTDIKDKGLKLLKETYVDEMVEQLLKNISMPEQHVSKILVILKDMLESSTEYEVKSLEEISKNITKLKTRLGKLYVDKLDETISEEFYFEKRTEWESELDELRSQYEYISKENDEYFERAKTILELCKNAYNYYIQNNNENKRLLLKLLTSNFSWNGQDLTITIKNTIKPMLNSVIFQNGGREETRTPMLSH